MRRSEVLQWLQDHGGQANYTVEPTPVANPDYDPDDKTSPKTISVNTITWTAADGQKMSVIDNSTKRKNSAEMQSRDVVPDPDDPEGGSKYDPDYDVVGSGKKDTTDNRSPESKANDEELDRQRKKNKADTGNWETDLERRSRENQENDRARQIAADEDRNKNEGRRIDIEQANSDRAASDSVAAQNSRDKSAENDTARVDIERDRYNLDKDKANRPSIVSQPTDSQAHIAVFDPTTGQVSSQENPIYDQAKVDGEALKQKLGLQIQLGNITQTQAAAEWQRWYTTNVEEPYKQSAEMRARTAEVRANQDAADRRKQFAASNDLAQRNLGETAGQNARANELAMLPYKVGPKFSGQFSSAINSLAAGGKIGNNAAAGVNFTPDAFSFQKPDLDAIAKKATKAALKGMTKYDPDAVDQAPTTDYSQINTNPDWNAAPQMPDVSGGLANTWNQAYPETPYQYQRPTGQP